MWQRKQHQALFSRQPAPGPAPARDCRLQLLNSGPYTKPKPALSLRGLKHGRELAVLSSRVVMRLCAAAPAAVCRRLVSADRACVDEALRRCHQAIFQTTMERATGGIKNKDFPYR